MDRIERKLQQLKEIGINGVILYFKGISNIDEISKGWTSKSGWTSCLLGGEYFQHEFGIPYMDTGKFAAEIDDVNNLESTISKWKGLYHLSFNGYESHMFTIYIKDNSVTLANTYGGIRHIVIKKFNRDLWIKTFVSAMNGNLDDYARAFDVARDKVTVRRVGFENLQYKHHVDPQFFLLEGPVNLREYFSYVWDPIYELSDEELAGEQFTPGEIKDIRAEQDKHVLVCRFRD